MQTLHVSLSGVFLYRSEGLLKLLSCVLPEPRHVQLDAWQIDEMAMQITLLVTSTQPLVHCPTCAYPARRIHSRYLRTVSDLPWGPWRVVLHLRVRKFFCANGRCTRRIFTERLSPLVAPWARRTQRLMHWAEESPLVPLQRFAKGLRDDYDAVKAGVTLPWSNGPVEGQINRLKMLKRQMFDRAKLDLLQQRFLLAA